jgi:hypothetical protein
LFSDYLKIGKFFPIVRIKLPRLRELLRFQFKAKYLYLLRNTASYPMWHDLRLSYQQLRLMIYPCRAPAKNLFTACLDVYFLGMPETRKRLPLNAYMKTKIFIFLAVLICFLSASPVKPAFAQPNQSPVANDDTAVTTDEDTPVDIDVLANDTDGDSDVLKVNSFDTTGANGGTVSCNPATTTPTPQCTYTPPANFSGTDTFTYCGKRSTGHYRSSNAYYPRGN